MFARQVIHLSNQELVCVPWRRGAPQEQRRFACSSEGLEDFAAWMRAWQQVPVRIVVDLVEEDFRVDTLPHLRPGDRGTVLRRRLAQVYRGTQFRMASLQGRETHGRRDDIALFTAIAQADLLNACLDTLAALRVPVLGVHPGALLGEGLLRRARIEAEQLLLVLLLTEDTVRISFFQYGRLKFSRISQPDLDPDGGLGPGLRAEARKTLQYVGAQPWFLRGSPVQTVLVAEQQDARAWLASWVDAEPPPVALEPSRLARQIGMRIPPVRSNATGVLLHLLMSDPPREQLAPPERTRDGRLWYVRSALFGISGLVATAALMLATFDVVQGLQFGDSGVALRQQVIGREHEVENATRRLPHSAISPDRMSAVVRFDDYEVRSVPQLQAALASLSLAVDASPAVLLQKVSWSITTRRPVLAAAAGAAPGSSARGDNAVISALHRRDFFEELRIEGSVAVPAGNPGAANAAVESLAARLRGKGREVHVVRMPYDLDPAHPLVASALEQAGRHPGFVLRMLVGPGV